MPSRKARTPQLVTRLGEIDNQRFRELVNAQKRPASDVLRDAVRYYLDYCDSQVVNYRETALERRLKRMEDRLASLLARLGLDIGIVYQYLWMRSDPETRAELFGRCYKESRNRLAGKLDVIEKEFVDLVKEKTLAEEKTGLKLVE